MRARRQILAAVCTCRAVACQNMDLYDRAVRGFREALALDPWCHQVRAAPPRFVGSRGPYASSHSRKHGRTGCPDPVFPQAAEALQAGQLLSAAEGALVTARQIPFPL